MVGIGHDVEFGPIAGGLPAARHVLTLRVKGRCLGGSNKEQGRRGLSPRTQYG